MDLGDSRGLQRGVRWDERVVVALFVCVLNW
jgi:hypothetical protein